MSCVTLKGLWHQTQLFMRNTQLRYITHSCFCVSALCHIYVIMIFNPLTLINAIICSINGPINITGYVWYIMVIMVGHYAAEQRCSNHAALHLVLPPSDLSKCTNRCKFPPMTTWAKSEAHACSFNSFVLAVLVTVHYASLVPLVQHCPGGFWLE